MKPAKGKHGSAMVERIAKKIQRQNSRRASHALLEAEVKESGLGIHQVAHFWKMDREQLLEAKAHSESELHKLYAIQESDARDHKITEHEKRIAFFRRRLKDK